MDHNLRLNPRGFLFRKVNKSLYSRKTLRLKRKTTSRFQQHISNTFKSFQETIKCSSLAVLHLMLDDEISIISSCNRFNTRLWTDIFSGCCTLFLSYDITGGSGSSILLQKDLYFAFCLVGSGRCTSFQMFPGCKYYHNVFSLAP